MTYDEEVKKKKMIEVHLQWGEKDYKGNPTQIGQFTI